MSDDENNKCQSPSKSNFKSFAKKISMGKKVEKILKIGKSPLNQSQSLGTSTNRLLFEPHKCTGKFKEDFENICTAKNFKYIPEVSLRGKRPGSSMHHVNQHNQVDTSKVEKAVKGAKGNKSIVNVEKETQENETEIGAENAEQPPKTYTIKDSIEYFKPKINVEMDNPDKLDTVTELHIKGWKIEKPYMEVLNLCLSHVDRLNTINFWNCGLEEDTVRILGSILGSCNNLKTLILDGNPLPTPAYHVLFFEDNSNVQNISLRNNQLDDEAVQLISFGIGDLKRQNTKLLHLNLSSNKIGDKGAINLARALRTNRTLLTLNLANNIIGDDGAKALSDVISRFQLTHEEIVHRRKVISGRTYEKSASPISRRGADSRERPNSQKSMPQNEVKKRSAKKEKEPLAGTQGTTNTGGPGGTVKNPKDTLSKTKKDEKTVRKDKGASIDSKAAKNQKQVVRLPGKRSAKEQDEINASGQVKNALLEISALTDFAENIEDGLWLIGNRNLLVLNLSRNNLTEKTIQYFVLALQYQKILLETHKNHGLGIMRLILQHNKFNYDNENYIKLLELLKVRDPFYKPPAPISNTNEVTETGSIHSGKESSLGKHKQNSKH